MCTKVLDCFDCLGNGKLIHPPPRSFHEVSQVLIVMSRLIVECYPYSFNRTTLCEPLAHQITADAHVFSFQAGDI